jgi:hypothetical protein
VASKNGSANLASWYLRDLPRRASGIAYDRLEPCVDVNSYKLSVGRSCERRDPGVSAIALIAAARTLFSALEQKPFFNLEARGDGSLRSQGRLVETSRKPCWGGLMRMIEGVVSPIVPTVSIDAALGKFQLRGAEIGGGPRPIGFLGRRLPM